MTRAHTWSAAALALAIGLPTGLAQGCSQRQVDRVLHRSGCNVCHQPLNEDGAAEGIADSHPWYPLTCDDCHGGNPWVCDGPVDFTGAEPRCDGDWVYDQAIAHPDPAGSPNDLRDLSSGALDDVDRDWLRFKNPGDPRVLSQTCGRCHTREAAAVRRSAHAHAAGELAVARFRSGAQPTPAPRFGSTAVVDPSRVQSDACAAVSVNQFSPLPIEVTSDDPLTAPTARNAQEQLLAKACVGCHVQDFGPSTGAGEFRSSGCSACHMRYAEDGLSVGSDPWIDKRAAPHPLNHALVSAPPSDTCMSCHHAGAYIGPAYFGLRPRADDEAPADVQTLGRAVWGKDADGWVVDDDPTNDFDETPPDVHFEAGMDCVDCHGAADTHGDGHLYADAACAVRARCADCHGTARVRGGRSATRPDIYEKDDGELYLRTRVTDRELRIPQVLDSITPGHPRFNAVAAGVKTVSGDDFTHSDALECVTCHAGWAPSCYGCHVEIDLTRASPYQTTGQQVAGAPTQTMTRVATHDLVLVRNQREKLALSVPASRLLMTLVSEAAGGGSETVFTDQPRVRPVLGGGRMASFGQRPIDPHTTRRRSAFMACDRCHSDGDLANPANAVLMDLTHGFGSDRFVVRACDVANDDASCDPQTDQRDYRLDALIAADGSPLVVMGHPEPNAARPLTLDEIDRMRAIAVPADALLRTPIPADAATNPAWPAPQDVE